jgi:hypothetical protein
MIGVSEWDSRAGTIQLTNSRYRLLDGISDSMRNWTRRVFRHPLVQ